MKIGNKLERLFFPSLLKRRNKGADIFKTKMKKKSFSFLENYIEPQSHLENVTQFCCPIIIIDNSHCGCRCRQSCFAEKN